MARKRAVCTIAFDNYLPFVRILAKSLRAHNGEMPLFVLLIPEGDLAECGGLDDLNILRLTELAIPALERMTRTYDRKQLSASLKPVLLRHLLQKGWDAVIFLDADILVTDCLDSVFAEVEGHALTLTPHVLNPSEVRLIPNFDKILLQVGMFNAGFIGVTSRPESTRFLAWWANKLSNQCLNDTPRGLHYDQRWLDHAVGFVGDLNILRDPGVNAAYWNLIGRTTRSDGGRYWVGDSRLKCLHFSGFDPFLIPKATSYFPEVEIDQFGDLAALFRQYASDLRSHGWTSRRQLDRAAPRLQESVKVRFATPPGDETILELSGTALGLGRRFLDTAVRLGEPVLPRDFARSGIRMRYGWSDDEDWGTWSEGSYSDLLLALPDGFCGGRLNLVFTVQGFVAPGHPRQEADVFLNGKFNETWVFEGTPDASDRSVAVTCAAASPGLLSVGFRLRSPASPMLLGLSADRRLLGIGLKGLRVEVIPRNA